MVARMSCNLCVEMLLLRTSKLAVAVLALLYFGLHSEEDDEEEEGDFVGDSGEESEADSEIVSPVG